MWTLSHKKKKNSGSASTQPIRGHQVHGGGTWGGSRSLRENVIKMCERSRRVHGRDAAFTGKLDYPTDPWRQVGLFSVVLHDFKLKPSGGTLTHIAVT